MECAAAKDQDSLWTTGFVVTAYERIKAPNSKNRKRFSFSLSLVILLIVTPSPSSSILVCAAVCLQN